MRTTAAPRLAYGPISQKRSDAVAALNHGEGILHLAPAWVPRTFCVPGRRLRLNDGDYFAFGGERGGIDERWLASTSRAANGPLTEEFEGVSLVIGRDGKMVPLSTLVDELGADLLGKRLWDAHRGWTAFSKFFDNAGPLPFHVHHNDELADRIGQRGKPESYFYPAEMNNHLGSTAVSFLGLRPGLLKDEFLERLRAFGHGGDNRITELSVGYRNELDTGWDIPAGVLHAPGSLLTYEPQAASDVMAICESWSSCRTLGDDLLWRDVPNAERGNFDYVMQLIDWDLNTDPLFAKHRFMRAVELQTDGSFGEQWISYLSEAFSAKKLTVPPGRTVIVRDAEAYGAVCIAGRGRLGRWSVEAATDLRFGQISNDEFFVSATVANRGVTIVNESTTQDLVLLKQFGPGNPERFNS